MSDLIMQLAGVIQRDIDNLKAVSQNVANANTVGYKAERTFNVMASNVAGPGVAGGLDDIQAQTWISTDGGALQHTGRATDTGAVGRCLVCDQDTGWCVVESRWSFPGRQERLSG